MTTIPAMAFLMQSEKRTVILWDMQTIRTAHKNAVRLLDKLRLDNTDSVSPIIIKEEYIYTIHEVKYDTNVFINSVQ